MFSTAAGRLLGPPVPLILAADAPAPRSLPPPLILAADGLDSIGADWGTFGDPCLALFLADGSTPPERLRGLLAAAWDHDALTALKLVCNLRGVRGSGKGDREGFYTAALWMHQAHPLTLALNLSALAEFGYIKDLPELLYRLVKGPDVRKAQKAKCEAWALAKASRKRGRSDDDPAAAPAPAPPSASAVGGVHDHRKAASGENKAAKLATLAAQARQMYDGDRAYRTLFDCVADFFAERLRADLDRKAAGKEREIGLAAKWCPSVDSSFNQATLLCEAIARRLFPNPNPDPDNADPREEGNYVYRVLRRLRREVLVPLRKVLRLPELYMSAQKWSELPYERVASKAMDKYKQIFLEHDTERFNKFVEDREARKAMIAAAGPLRSGAGAEVDDVLPHEIVGFLDKATDNAGEWRYQLAWRRLVDGLRNGGLLRNCIAVCDLSAGMRGTGRNVCVALALLVSELGEDPWDNLVFSFHEEDLPYDISSVANYNIRGKVDAVLSSTMCRPSSPGSSSSKVDLRLVFEHILRRASLKHTSPEKMVRTIFVLTTDQQFERAVARPWRRDYQAVCEAFTNSGFGDVVPQVVYWNIGGRRSAALTSTRDGVLRLSGFSDGFFKLFLEKGGIVGPEDEMQASIKGHAYDDLQVFD